MASRIAWKCNLITKYSVPRLTTDNIQSISSPIRASSQKLKSGQDENIHDSKVRPTTSPATSADNCRLFNFYNTPNNEGKDITQEEGEGGRIGKCSELHNQIDGVRSKNRMESRAMEPIHEQGCFEMLETNREKISLRLPVNNIRSSENHNALNFPELPNQKLQLMNHVGRAHVQSDRAKKSDNTQRRQYSSQSVVNPDAVVNVSCNKDERIKRSEDKSFKGDMNISIGNDSSISDGSHTTSLNFLRKLPSKNSSTEIHSDTSKLKSHIDKFDELINNRKANLSVLQSNALPEEQNVVQIINSDGRPTVPWPSYSEAVKGVAHQKISFGNSNVPRESSRLGTYAIQSRGLITSPSKTNEEDCETLVSRIGETANEKVLYDVVHSSQSSHNSIYVSKRLYGSHDVQHSNRCERMIKKGGKKCAEHVSIRVITKTKKKLPQLPEGDCSPPVIQPPSEKVPLVGPLRRYKPKDPKRSKKCLEKISRADDNWKMNVKPLHKICEEYSPQCVPLELKNCIPLKRLEKKSLPECIKCSPPPPEVWCPPRSDSSLKIEKKTLPIFTPSNCEKLQPEELPYIPLARLPAVKVIEPKKNCETPKPDIIERADDNLNVEKKELPILSASNCPPAVPLKMRAIPQLRRLNQIIIEQQVEDCTGLNICDTIPRSDSDDWSYIEDNVEEVILGKCSNNPIISNKNEKIKKKVQKEKSIMKESSKKKSLPILIPSEEYCATIQQMKECKSLTVPIKRYRPKDPSRSCPEPPASCCRADDNWHLIPKPFHEISSSEYCGIDIEMKESPPLRRLEKVFIPEPIKYELEVVECVTARADGAIKVQPRKLPPLPLNDCPCIKEKELPVVPLPRLPKVKIPEYEKKCKVEKPCTTKRADDELQIKKKKLPILRNAACTPVDRIQLRDVCALKRLKPFTIPEPQIIPPVEEKCVTLRSDIDDWAYTCDEEDWSPGVCSSESTPTCLLPPKRCLHSNSILSKSLPHLEQLSQVKFNNNRPHKNRIQRSISTATILWRSRRKKEMTTAGKKESDEYGSRPKYLQPKHPLLPPFPRIEPVPPKHAVIDPELEDRCVRKKFNIENKGFTIDCCNPNAKRKYYRVHKDESIPCEAASAASKPPSNEPCSEIVNTCPCPPPPCCPPPCCPPPFPPPCPPPPCPDPCEEKEKESFMKSTSSKGVIKASDPCRKIPKPVCGPHKKLSLWQRFLNYFKARPNCPAPGDWKKEKLRRNAEEAAKKAGLCLYDPKQCRVSCDKPPSPCCPPILTKCKSKRRKMHTCTNVGNKIHYAESHLINTFRKYDGSILTYQPRRCFSNWKKPFEFYYLNNKMPLISQSINTRSQIKSSKQHLHYEGFMNIDLLLFYLFKQLRYPVRKNLSAHHPDRVRILNAASTKYDEEKDASYNDVGEQSESRKQEIMDMLLYLYSKLK